MYDPISIERINPVSKEHFYKHYVRQGRPVIIMGLVSNWQAFGLWSMEYISNQYANVEVDAVPFKNGRLDMDPHSGCKIERITIEQSIPYIQEGDLNKGWAIATSIKDFPSEIQQQCPPAIYCSSDALLRAKVLIGPMGSVTSLHQDLFENLYTIVSGCKRITLFAPSESVYRCSPFSKLPNFAKVNPEDPDYSRFPKFKNAQPYMVDLRPGETLYIPAFWWHHLRNTEPTIAVSFWWSQGWKRLLVKGALMYKKILGG